MKSSCSTSSVTSAAFLCTLVIGRLCAYNTQCLSVIHLKQNIVAAFIVPARALAGVGSGRLPYLKLAEQTLQVLPGLTQPFFNTLSCFHGGLFCSWQGGFFGSCTGTMAAERRTGSSTCLTVVSLSMGACSSLRVSLMLPADDTHQLPPK